MQCNTWPAHIEKSLLHIQQRLCSLSEPCSDALVQAVLPFLTTDTVWEVALERAVMKRCASPLCMKSIYAVPGCQGIIPDPSRRWCCGNDCWEYIKAVAMSAGSKDPKEKNLVESVSALYPQLDKASILSAFQQHNRLPDDAKRVKVKNAGATPAPVKDEITVPTMQQKEIPGVNPVVFHKWSAEAQEEGQEDDEDGDCMNDLSLFDPVTYLHVMINAWATDATFDYVSTGDYEKIPTRPEGVLNTQDTNMHLEYIGQHVWQALRHVGNLGDKFQDDGLVLYEVDNVVRTLNLSFTYEYKEIFRVHENLWTALGLIILAAIARFRYKESASCIDAAWQKYFSTLHPDTLKMLTNDFCPAARPST